MSVAATAAPLRVAWARARARPARGAIVAVGVALATAAVAGVAGGGTITADLELHRALEQLPPAERSFAATWLGGLPQGGYASVDRQATATLRDLSPTAPARTLAFPELNLNGTLVTLGAVDHPGRWLHLVSGRLPGACTPRRCEVVQTGGTRVASVSEPGVRLVVVGRTSGPLPFESAPLSHAAHGQTRTPPMLLAGNVQELSALPAFGALYRTYAWTAPLDPAAVHDWQVPGLLERESRAAQALERSGNSGFGLSSPADALAAAHADDRVAGNRLLLVGGGAAALLIGFVVMAAGGLRRDARAEWARLERHGARAWQLWLEAGIEAAWVTLAGVVLGALLAVAAIWIAAGQTGLAAGPVLTHSLATSRGALLLAGVWIGSAALLIAVERISTESARLGPFHALDLVAVAAVAAAALAASRGASTSASLAAGSDPLLALLPGLAAVAAGALVARLAGPALRLAGRGSRRGPVAVRLALVSLGRQGGRPALAAAYITGALGLAIFAVSYRATLRAGESDQAAFQVPLDFTLTEGAALRRPLDVAPPARYRALAPHTIAVPILRTSVAVPGPGTPVQPTLVGVPAALLPRLHWRSDYADVSPAALAHLLSPGRPPRMATARLPASARRLSLAVTGSGRAVVLQVAVRRPDGTFDTIQLGTTGAGRLVLSAPIPAADRGGGVAGLEIGLTPADAQALEHAGIEGGLTIVANGALRLAPLRAGGEAVTDFSGWLARGTATLGGGPGRIDYALDGRANGLVRPPQPSDGSRVPLLASTDVAQAAGPGGRLALALPDGRSVPAQVVAVGNRFPTTGSSFAIADEATLALKINADAPGTAVPDEMWVGVPPDETGRVQSELRRPPFSALAVRSRSGIRASEAGRPLARGILIVLEAAAVLAVLLAAAGLVLVGASDLADERPHLDDLEAMGVPPRVLRVHLILRAVLMAVAGIAGGIVLGIALSRAVVDLVQLGAGSATAVPPLRAEASLPTAAAAVVAFTILGLLPVALMTGRSAR